MNSFQQKFRKYINENRLFEPEDRILLAVSGGIDSSVLAHLLSREHAQWAMAHANFQLRAEESDQDEAFIKSLAETYQVPCYTQTFDTKTYAQQQQISIQMAARELRRAWFLELLSQEKYDYIALAHHHNDQLETLLLNVTKGTGISGLRAMLPKKGVWIRPLLFTVKKEVMAYAEEHQLHWQEERSNAEDKYQRNWVRHRIIPALQKINPSVLSTSQHTLARLREVEAIFKAEVDRVGQQALRMRGMEMVIQKTVLSSHPQATSLLTEWLSPYGFSWTDARQIIISLQGEAQPGLQFLSTSHTLWVDREELVIIPQESEPETISVTHEEAQITRTPLGHLQATVLHREKYQITAEPLVAALDYQQLQFPLTLRTWEPGDAFQPLGMKHRKKVSDFLVDAKVPRYQKPQVLVVLSAGEIIWVVGHRVDHRFRVTDQTRQVYEIAWHPAKV
ncbi:MAG: tRNA lysidine(34) synthetase TilS [Cyclobacteriaceae bacterium]